jgi:hypothetical protein
MVQVLSTSAFVQPCPLESTLRRVTKQEFPVMFNTLGWISLILAPFTGVTLVTAVCFFILASLFEEY